MTVRLYQSTDGSAPSLTGVAGSLVALLDAILVDGYGAKTAAGWTKSFTASNKRSYLQNLTGSNNVAGMHLYVDDSAPTTAKEARWCGFETMSAITPVGTGQFPTGSQSAIGVGTLVCRKSTTADATARPWICIADGHTVYLFVDTGDITTPLVGGFPLIFGDFKSYKVGGDPYAVICIGRNIENSGVAQNDPLQLIPPQQWSATRVAQMQQNYIGHYIARTFTGVGGSKRVGKTIDLGKWAESTYGNQGASHFSGGYVSDAQTTVNPSGVAIGYTSDNPMTYPLAVDSSMYLSPIEIVHDGAPHGYLKGLWAPLHHRPVGHKNTYNDGGAKSFIAAAIPVYDGASAQNVGEIHVEYSDTWPA